MNSEDDLDERIRNLHNGTIIDAVPRKMKVGVPKQFLVAISRTPNLDWSGSTGIVRDFEREDIKPEEIVSDTLPVHIFMKVV